MVACGSPKHNYISVRGHGVTSQKMIRFIFTAVRISGLTEYSVLGCNTVYRKHDVTKGGVSIFKPQEKEKTEVTRKCESPGKCRTLSELQG
jgi:hypothetical protein